MADRNGNKTGGRKKGTPNKNTKEVMATLDAMGCNPIEGLARIAMGDAPCLSCRDGQVTAPQFYRMTKLSPPLHWKGRDARSLNRMMVDCPNCSGTGVAIVSSELSGNMFKELAQYVAPKRKAIEVEDKTNGHEAFLHRLEVTLMAEAKQNGKGEKHKD